MSAGSAMAPIAPVQGVTESQTAVQDMMFVACAMALIQHVGVGVTTYPTPTRHTTSVACAMARIGHALDAMASRSPISHTMRVGFATVPTRPVGVCSPMKYVRHLWCVTYVACVVGTTRHVFGQFHGGNGQQQSRLGLFSSFVRRFVS